MIPSRHARAALAAHLRARLGLAASAVLPDFPPATLALPRPVALAVIDAGEVIHGAETGGAQLVSLTPGAGAAATAVYRTGEWRIPLAVELWCATSFERDTRIAQIRAALNEPPTVAGAPVVDVAEGLTLTLADYFSAPATFDCEGWTAMPAAEGVAREEWRARFEVTARVDDLTTKATTRLTATTLDVHASPTTTP